MPFRACFVTRKNAAHEARFRTASRSPAVDRSPPLPPASTTTTTPTIASVEHTIARRVTFSPMNFTATGNTMTGVSDPMIATFAIDVIRTDVKYSATLRPKHTPPNHERLITSHVRRRFDTSSAAVSSAPPIHSR